MGQVENLTAQCGQFDRRFLQFVEQCHRLFLRKTAFQLLDSLVVIHADGTVLGVQRGEFRVVIDERLIDFHYRKRRTTVPHRE